MKKTVKRLIALSLALLMALALVGCTGGGPEKAVKDYVKAVKKLDLEKVAELTYSKEDDAGTKENNLEKEEEKLAKLLFKKIDCKVIESEEVDEETAEVTVEITNIDFEDLMKKMEEKGKEMENEAAGLSEEKHKELAMELFEKCLKDKSLKETTSQVKVTVVLDDGKWKIGDGVENLDFTMALFAGMLLLNM